MRAVNLRRRHLRARGQALVELSLAAPIIIVLLGGGAQVATISYAHVTVATAAREEARYAAHHPDALPSSVTPYKCGSAPNYDPTTDTSVSAPICKYVSSINGMLAAGSFTVTISGNYSLATVPDDVQRIDACSGQHDATVSGTVSPWPVPAGQVVTVSGSFGGSIASTGVDTNGGYTLCLDAQGGPTQTVTATTGHGCSYYTGSVGPLNLEQGKSYSEDIPMTTSACPTPTPTATPTPSPSPSPSPSPTSTGTPGIPPSGGGASCIGSTSYVRVDVTYTVPIFVPFIGRVFANSSGGHTVTESVTMKVDPCDITVQ
jgi:hypothetical protein